VVLDSWYALIRSTSTSIQYKTLNGTQYKGSKLNWIDVAGHGTFVSLRKYKDVKGVLCKRLYYIK